MKINVKITRQQNADYFGKAIGDTVDVELEDYIAAVVASEVGNSHIEACKAQAVAARTFSYPYWSKGKTITDSSSSHQAYRAIRNDASKYPNAVNAAKQTAGQILTYNGKVISSCPFSSSNGGRTVSSQERWGGVRPWLIAQDDPWDAAAGSGRGGHGVGMSQRGAKYAASIGVTYDMILSFYYVGTEIGGVAYPSTADTDASDETTVSEQTAAKEETAVSDEAQSSSVKGCDRMIKPNALIEKFRYALKNGWGYIYGSSGQLWTQAKQNAATREQTIKWGKKWIGKNVADCSGLFTWAFKQLGGFMYHGSNTMYKKYCTDKGTLTNGKRSDGKELKPGTSVYKYNDTDGYHHVGLYIGDNTVIEAKGTYYGVVTSKPAEWTHWGELKGVDYSSDSSSGTDSGSTTTEETESGTIMTATVTTTGGKLNLRKSSSTTAALLVQIPNGEKVTVLDNSGDWWKITYGSTTGYAMAKFLTAKSEAATLAELEQRIEVLEELVRGLTQKDGD